MTPEWRTPGLQTAPSATTLTPSSSSSSTSMASTASSSRLSVPRPHQRSRKTDVFKPRFPLDPFAGASAAALGEPWFLKVDALLAATSYPRRDVIFVLGAPTLKDLVPLFQSRHLAQSLVILATHNPPDIPHIVLPTVRILHLSAPLALEDAGAVRFVNVLEWAERIARTWRKHGGAGVLELSEELDIHSELAPPSVLRFSGSQSTPTSPGSSSTHLSESSSPPRPPSLFRPLSSSSGRFGSRGRQTSQSLPPPDPSQRPFDALINFLPDHVSDKALLKNSILVTTISRPFLVSNGPAPPPHRRTRTESTGSASRLPRPQSFLNAFSRSSASVYLPPTPHQSGESLSLPNLPPPPPTKALLVHLLPAPPANVSHSARRKLVQSMESFLVSFSLQATAASVAGETLERARPYMMQTTTFCDSVGCEPGVVDWGDWTVADIVLSGALDAEAQGRPGSSGTNTGVGTASHGKARAVPKTKTSRRAWIATAADLVIMPSSDEASSASSLNPDATGVRAGQDSSYFPQQPPRALDKGSRSPSLPVPIPDSSWARPHSHPQMSMAHSFSSVLSRQRSPCSSAYSPGTHQLPTPPHSEESECTSSSPSTSPREPRSPVGSFDGSAHERNAAKRSGWKFWKRLSHMPTAIRA
ncbi:hypothetical protein C8Q77DRAFT_1132351 [Trametes polyzona]|nr:hypothetical protein C8Q77DRAFT_1132351 [Trametes polyzona]